MDTDFGSSTYVEFTTKSLPFDSIKRVERPDLIVRRTGKSVDAIAPGYLLSCHERGASRVVAAVCGSTLQIAKN